MSAAILEIVWRTSRATGSAKHVLLALADAAHDDATAQLAILEIARAAQVGDRQVQRNLRALEALGEIVASTVHGRGLRNAYTITLALAEKVTPATPIPDENVSLTTPFPEKASPITPFPATAPEPAARSAAATTGEKVQRMTPFLAAADDDLLNATNRSSSSRERRRSSQLPHFADDAIPMLLAVRLRDRILTTLPSAKVPTTSAQLQTWARTLDLMIRLDHRPPDSIRDCMDYAHREPFWQSHVLSAEILRKHYQTLEVQRHHAATRLRTPGRSAASSHAQRPRDQQPGTPEYQQRAIAQMAQQQAQDAAAQAEYDAWLRSQRPAGPSPATPVEAQAS